MDTIYGVVAGSAAGFTGSSGNAWVRGTSSSEIFRQGLNGALWGGAMGAVAGGISGGIEAIKHGGNLWTGEGATHNFLLSTDAENTITVGKNMEYL